MSSPELSAVAVVYQGSTVLDVVAQSARPRKPGYMAPHLLGAAPAGTPCGCESATLESVASMAHFETLPVLGVTPG